LDRGADHPIIRDEGVLRGSCEVLQGGVIKPSAPVFTPIVTNESDLTWRDDDGDLTVLQEDTGEVILIDDNT